MAEQQKSVLVAQDVFRHDPIPVRMASPGMRQLPFEFQTRYVSKRGMLLEIAPPIRKGSPFIKGLILQLQIRLPHQEEGISVEGKVAQTVCIARDAEGKEFTLVGVRFDQLDIDCARRLEAHELAFNRVGYVDRSARIPVEFPVEPEGIDVMSEMYVHDLSMTGMFVGARAKFQVGKELRLRFCLPAQTRKVGLFGRVVWQGEKELPGLDRRISGFGFQFLQVPPSTRAALATYYTRRTITVWK